MSTAVCSVCTVDDKTALDKLHFFSLLLYRGSTRTILALFFFFKFPPVHVLSLLIVLLFLVRQINRFDAHQDYRNQHASISSTTKTATPPWEAFTENPLSTPTLLFWPAVHAYNTLSLQVVCFHARMPRSLGAHALGVRSYTSAFHSLVVVAPNTWDLIEVCWGKDCRYYFVHSQYSGFSLQQQIDTTAITRSITAV